MLYGRKRIKSGPMLEDLYAPILPSGKLAPGSIPKTQGTSKPQAEYNAKQSMYEWVRIINANFDTGDIFMHPTFADDNPRRPKTYDEACRRIKAYVRRVRRWRKDHGVKGEFKYAYRIEVTERKSGEYKGEKMYHFHVFLTRMDRDAAEELWIDGERVNADKFDPWRFGQEAAARYTAKDFGNSPARRKRFVCSRNCKKPARQKKPRKMNISKRRAAEMASEHTDDAAYWQAKAPKGYVFTGMQYVLNPYNNMYYWRVTYRRLPPAPPRKKS